MNTLFANNTTNDFTGKPNSELFPLAALSGASPTTYYVWRQVMESATRNRSMSVDEEMRSNEIMKQSYNDLHLSTFQTFEEHELDAMIENSPMSELNMQDHNGNTPLAWAVSEGRSDIVQCLLDQGAEVNMQNYDGETPLYIAAARGFSRICEILILNGANANICNIDGASPAHIAASSGHIEVLAVLIKYGGFINAQDDEGDCLLHYAVREGQMASVQFLVNQCRAEVHLRNEDDETPLELATILGESDLVKFLSSASNATSSCQMEIMMMGNEKMTNLSSSAAPVQW